MEDAETYKKMLARDERRFRVADQDGDSMATREELTAFLHPEEFPHMRDIVVAVSTIAENMPPKPVPNLSWVPASFTRVPAHHRRCRTAISPGSIPLPVPGTSVRPSCVRCSVPSLSPDNRVLRRASGEHRRWPDPERTQFI